jgi:hypothetical protein
MNKGAISGVGFEGTGVKKARRKANAQARDNFVSSPVITSDQAKQPSITIPVATLMALLAIATPQFANAQQTAAPTFPPDINPALIVRPGQEIPAARFNQLVMFTDDQGYYAGVRLVDTQNRPNRFNKIEFISIGDGEIFRGEVRSYNPNSGSIVIRGEDGKEYTLDVKNYEENKQALRYIRQADTRNMFDSRFD